VEATLVPSDAHALTQLKRDLALVISAEARFTLTDLCKLSPDDAIASAGRLAAAITSAALRKDATAHS
jgi:hypothetical protein